MLRGKPYEGKVRKPRRAVWTRLDALLFAHQQALIDQAVGGVSAAFRRYEAEYRRATGTAGRPIRRAAVEAEVREADVVYVGDYHTLPQAQAEYLALVRGALEAQRPVALALEFLEQRHQPALDAYLQGRRSLQSLARSAGYHPGAAFDLFDRFAPLLAFAKRHRLRVAAIDSRPGGPRSLARRDALAAEAIARLLDAPDSPRVLVLVGQYHVAPAHLPACVQRQTPHRALVVYQNPEGPYWARRHPRGRPPVEALALGRGAVALFSASPLDAQRTFLDYAQPGGDGAQTFRFVHRTLARALGIRAALPARLEVLTGDATAAGRVLARRLRRTDWAPVARTLRGLDARWFGGARAVWLASSAPHPLAREASRALLQSVRGIPTDFWSLCLEECLAGALAHLVAPSLRGDGLADWRVRFRRGPTSQRALAAFVLAQVALPASAEALAVAPPWPSPLADAAAAALGQLAAARLPLSRRTARAWLREHPTAAAIRALLARAWGRQPA